MDISSLLLFSVDISGRHIIKYFSHRHKLHFLLTFEYDRACFILRHLMLYIIFLSFTSNGLSLKETVGLPKLHERREKISIDLFDEIVCNPTHSLHSLLPERKSCKYALRRKSDFTLPLCKTERLKNSFIFSHVYKM